MGGSTPLPTPSTPGYTSFRGFTACVCLAQWLPVVERLGILRGLIVQSIDIVQLTGLAPASAGVHAQGGVFDVKQRTDAWVALFREAGAPASWRRDTGEFATNQHLHGVLTGCPHNDPAAYQITAQKRGYNGLGQGAPGTPYAGMWGYGGLDPHPDPTVYRTWQQGITWAKAEIAKLEEDIMASIDDLRKVVREELAATPKAVWEYQLQGHDSNPTDGVPAATYPARSHLVMANWRASDLQANVAKLAGSLGVDENALAAALAPVVRQAVIDSGQPETVADAVVSKLGDALKP